MNVKNIHYKLCSNLHLGMDPEQLRQFLKDEGSDSEPPWVPFAKNPVEIGTPHVTIFNGVLVLFSRYY